MHTSSSWTFGPYEFDAGAFRLRRGGTVIPLEPKAIDVLRLLLERAPRVVEKTEIFAVVWKDTAVTDNALTRVIAQLRKALEDDAKSPRYIETVATRGYRFLADVCRSDQVTATTRIGPIESVAADLWPQQTAPAPSIPIAMRRSGGRARLPPAPQQGPMGPTWRIWRGSFPIS
jgi:eukaryotic-like serine/threonine-protein kinase